MAKDTESSNGSHGSDLPGSWPITVDIKGACKIMSISSDTLRRMLKDPALNFPESIQVGRSVRWFVADLIAWLRTRQGGNVPQQSVDNAKKKEAVGPRRGKPAKPEEAPSGPTSQKKKGAMVPTLAEVEAANRKLQSAKLLPGQRLLRRLIDTRDGTKVWQNFTLRRHPVWGFKPVEVRPPKIIVPMGIPADERQRLLARVAAMRGGATIKPSSPAALAAAPKKIASAHHKEVSPAEMKVAYEVEGLTADELCKRYRMGKGRVMRLLCEAGTKMRSPGRKSRPGKP